MTGANAFCSGEASGKNIGAYALSMSTFVAEGATGALLSTADQKDESGAPAPYV